MRSSYTLSSAFIAALLFAPAAEARMLPNAQVKQSIRKNDRANLKQNNRVKVTVPEKFSDLRETKKRENFVLGYAFEHPTNWIFTNFTSPTPPYPLLPTYRTPADSLHPGTANFSFARMRVDENYTASQLVSRGMKMFSETLKPEGPTSIKIGTYSALSSSYKAPDGEVGRLVVIPKPNDAFAYVLFYRGNSQAAFDLNLKVFEHVLGTFRILN
jgi:hypothetical protein